MKLDELIKDGILKLHTNLKGETVSVKIHQEDENEIKIGQLNESNDLHGIGKKIHPWAIIEG